MATSVCKVCGEDMILVSGKLVCPECSTYRHAHVAKKEPVQKRPEAWNPIHPKNRGA